MILLRLVFCLHGCSAVVIVAAGIDVRWRWRFGRRRCVEGMIGGGNFAILVFGRFTCGGLSLGAVVRRQ